MQDFGQMEVPLGQKATTNIPYHVSIQILENLNGTHPTTIDNTNIRKMRETKQKAKKKTRDSFYFDIKAIQNSGHFKIFDLYFQYSDHILNFVFFKTQHI
jgi:hypothetical protein